MTAADRVVVVGPAALSGLLAALLWGYKPDDWMQIGRAGDAILSGNLHVYVDHPDAQVGPLAAVIASLPRPLFAMFVCALLGVLLTLVRSLGASEKQALVGGMILAGPWTFYALEGHADDALVVVGTAVMVVGLRRGRPGWVGWGFVLAMAAKPTAVILAPLLILAGWPAVLLAVVGSVAVWAPFVFADVSGFLEAGKGIANVTPWSVPDLLGADRWAAFPPWVRPAQLVGGLAICWTVLRVRGPAAAVLVAFTFRVALEPGVWPSYTVTLIALALLLPAFRLAAAGLAFGLWVVTWSYPLDAPEGVFRLVLLVGVITVGLRAGSTEQRDGSRRSVVGAGSAA